MSDPLNKSLVKHFMTHPLFFVSADHTLEQAEKVFHEYRLTTAPVLIDKKTVLGILTDFQLLKCFLMKNAAPTRAKLKDYTTEFDPVILIDENESITQAFKLMMQSPNHRIYVTAQDRLVGALSPKDILPFMAGDDAIERHKDDQDLIAARIRIKLLMSELTQTKSQLDDYQQAFFSSPYMIHSVDLQGNITMANRMLESVLGYESGQLIGKNLTQLYPPQFHKDAKDGLTRVKVTGFHPLINTMMVRADKTLVQVDLATTAKIDQRGDIIGTITIGRLSDSSKMLEALSHLARAIKETDVV